MKNIQTLGENISLKIDENPLYHGNEAELRRVVISYKADVEGILKDTSEEFLLRRCTLWNEKEHNQELQEIYDYIVQINQEYESQEKEYRLNVVEHFTDDDENIYTKHIGTQRSLNVYDLMPDAYYIDPKKKVKSRFKEFKSQVNELNLNTSWIITHLFEQLAVLHANNLVVWAIQVGEEEINHPTLSLFLYSLKQKKGNVTEEIHIHDIHNLKILKNPDNFDIISHCKRDIKNMAYDIIRFFKGILLPQCGFKVYWETLKKLNPEMYKIMYHAFLWNPVIEIELWIIEKEASARKKERNSGQKLSKKLEKNEVKTSINMKDFFGDDNIFYLKARREKIQEFLENINVKNTQIIIDFDQTITYPWENNAFNIWFQENGEVRDFEHITKDEYDTFILRKWAIAFLKLLMQKGFEVKIYSLWFREIIETILVNNGLQFPKENIFANSRERIVYDKKEIGIVPNELKKSIILGDSLVDFDIATTHETLKIWFLNGWGKDQKREKKMSFNSELDMYYLSYNSDFIRLFYLLNKITQ